MQPRLDMATNERDLGGQRSRLSAKLAEVIEKAVALGFSAPSPSAVSIANSLAAATIDRYGPEVVIRPEVGPRGIIELSVALEGVNRFIAFVHGDGSSVRVELSPRVKPNDPEGQWIAQTFSPEALGLA